MSKEVISSKQGIILIALFIVGSTVVLQTGAEAGKDLWIAIIIAMILALVISLFYARIMALYPGKDLFQISQQIFGKVGMVINLLYIWYALHLGALVLRNFGEFVNTVSLPETPRNIFILGMTIISLMAVKEGLEVLARFGELFIGPLLFFVAFALFFLLFQADINNLRPILYEGWGPVLKSSFSVFGFPFGETIILTMAFFTFNERKNSYKVFTSGILMGGLIVLLTSIVEVMVLGVDIYSVTHFPSYSAVARLEIGNFIQRVEIIVAVVFIIAGFIKISLCLLAATKGVARILSYQDYRFLVAPMSLLMIVLSHIVYDNILEMQEWASRIYPYYAIPFQLLLPIIILIGAQLKKR